MSAEIDLIETGASAVAAEAADRAAADAAEATARQNADTAEATARANAIAAEATTRANADSAESTTRAAAIASLAAQLATEIARALAAESTKAPSTSLATEIADREAAISALQTSLDTEATTRANGDSTEAAARLAADALLVPLTQRGAASGVATLDGTVHVPDAQIPASIARDAEVAAAVAAEATARDAAITTAIDSLINGAGSAVDTLKELADLIASDESGIAALTTAIAAKQDADAKLTALAGVTAVADRLPYFTGPTAIGLATFTAFARTLLAGVDASAMRTSLGLGSAAVASSAAFDAAGAAAAAQAASQPLSANLTALAGVTGSSYGRSLLTAADALALRTLAGLGSAATSATGDFDAAGAATAAQAAAIAASQPLDATLTALAALATAADKLIYATGVDTFATTDLTALARTLVGRATAALMRSDLGLGSAALNATGDFDASGAAAAAQAFAIQRANHTGSQAHTTVSDWDEAVQDTVGAMFAGDSADLDFTYDDAGNIDAALLKPTAVALQVRRWYVDCRELPNRNTGGSGNWPNSYASGGTVSARGFIYNLSPGGAGTTAEIAYSLWLPAGDYRAFIEIAPFNNMGNGQAFLNGVSLGTWDGYLAGGTLLTTSALMANTVTLVAAGVYELVIKQLGTKNASSSNYFVAFVGAYLTKTA